MRMTPVANELLGVGLSERLVIRSIGMETYKYAEELPRTRDRLNGPQRLTALDVMTVSEVAELMHVPESTVGDWARRSVIPSKKLGRRRIFIRAEIEALLLADN